MVVVYIISFLLGNTLIASQVIDIITASTNDMGPSSLGAFKKSNLSASWRVAGVDSSVANIESQVRISVIGSCFILYSNQLLLHSKVYTIITTISIDDYPPIGKTNSV